MPLLIKLTTEFSETEDRLCLKGRGEDDHIYELWLTRRLGDRLFRAMLDWLQQQNAALGSNDLFQTFEQEKAASNLEPTEAVKAESLPIKSWLIHNIDITKAKEGIVLTFKDCADLNASLAMSPTEARQWLAICFHHYQKAEWPTMVWPAWMTSDKEPLAQTQH